MRLIQFTQNGRHVAALVDGEAVRPSKDGLSVYELAGLAETAHTDLEHVMSDQLGAPISYQALIETDRLVPPFTHPDPFKMLVAGTGLTHLGSAATRAEMHASDDGAGDATDSMKMFRAGIDGGKPSTGHIGVQPEWFYKGDGSCVVSPFSNFVSPAFGEDFSEEPELAALYRIGQNGTPMRIGFAIGNEASDHVTEKQNYLLLAHSKLRQCSFGPEILVGDLPDDIRGTSTLIRAGEVIWEKPFLTGEANMSHSIANLEHHHFKYDLFRRPGAAHVHFMGTATLSFGDGIRTQPGDVFNISAPEFGRTLSNGITQAPSTGNTTVRVL